MTEPTPEQLISTLARKFRVDVDTSATAAPAWLQVRAVQTFKPTINNTMVDDADMDSDGWGSDAKTGMKWALELGLLRKVGLTSGSYDPGQEAIRAAADDFGPDAVVHVRWYDRNGGPEAYEGYAQVGWSPNGGGPTALDIVAVTLSGNGARKPIANPTAPVGP